MAFTNDNKFLVSASYDGSIKVLDLESPTKRSLHIKYAHDGILLSCLIFNRHFSSEKMELQILY